VFEHEVQRWVHCEHLLLVDASPNWMILHIDHFAELPYLWVLLDFLAHELVVSQVLLGLIHVFVMKLVFFVLLLNPEPLYLASTEDLDVVIFVSDLSNEFVPDIW
jgi:hypothetical protein